MKVSHREWPLLVFGDLIVFSCALYLTLLIRYTELPSEALLAAHIPPFAILAFVWIIVFVIVGLYDIHSTILRSKLPQLVVRTQFVNILIAAAFFFVIPYFEITPKTNLLIFLVMSSFLLIQWRLFLFPFFGFKKKNTALIIGNHDEAQALCHEVNQNARYGISFSNRLDAQVESTDILIEQVRTALAKESIQFVVLNVHDPQMDRVMSLLVNHPDVEILDMVALYEDVFQRVPVSLISNEWIVETIRAKDRLFYTVLKRSIDMVGAGVLGVCSILLFPFVWLAIKLDDRGPLYIAQERVGQDHHIVRIHKFRTMSGTTSDTGDAVLKSEKKITRVGAFLRNTRIDELPQLWSVMVGTQSLIGPRPELPALASVYAENIPHYATRHMVRPGLSGWAQIHHQAHPHHGTDVDETKVKLSYDLYYVKNRSILLDILIALRTIYILFSRVGK